ncbi:MAG: BREX system P-loop protein BrxC [Emergencia sp.]|nr:BREX system P-loop protein BrxC [Emergencia sp.]
MILRDIYKSDINRSLNGVIKVAQDDTESIKQELTEYIITRELRQHFNTFLTNYENSLATPTDKIGVWISGFFGSGKSHFLKILSYLISNREIEGKQAVTYFADKFDNPMMFAQLERCASVPTDTILFNIDSKSPLEKDKTAILRVFAKVFYEHLGFYGNDLKVAKLEAFIEKSGKTAEFKEKFAEINGGTWEESRDSFAFFEDDVVDALVQTLDMSETAARNWFNGTETADLSIDQLVHEIRHYVDSRGADYRLLFMVDEVGQYIGSDSDLMLNLQTIVEEIGTQCAGRVWVMVTSQEAIDSITKISGDDFSKIQGRFNTRLSLSSSSVDEVIKKRILAKTENAEQMLRMNYDRESAVLKNLFTFHNDIKDIKGYSDEIDFVESYPFVPYQFRLMQNVLTQIRKHGNSGKHLSAGERSMLSGFQEAAQAIQEKDENALAPFSLFYKTVHTFLEGAIRRVIDRCQKAADDGNGIESYDVEILKLLYLIRYVDDVKGNLDNITTLMVDDIRADKINMRKQVQESLDRLLSQNYIARNGEIYTFLTDDEQDIAREISQTPVDDAAIVQSIADSIFGDIYVNKKFKFGKYDFSYDQYIDETAIGQLSGGMGLRIVTNLYQIDEQRLIMKSAADREAIFVLSDGYDYYTELVNAKKIRKYVKSRNVSQLPEAQQNIIRNRQQEASTCEKRAAAFIGHAIAEGRCFVAGEEMPLRGSNGKDKLDSAMEILVQSVYTKLPYINTYLTDDSEILTMLSKENMQISMNSGMTVKNAEAVLEVEQYLEMQEARLGQVSMGDVQRRFSGVPYGWKEIDIAGLVASLIASQKVTVQYGGSTIQPTDRRMPDYLRRRSEIDKTIIRRRVAIPDVLMKKSREFLREYFNAMDVPMDEDGLISFVIERFSGQQKELEQRLQQYAQHTYPDKRSVESGIDLCKKLLKQSKDNTALLKTMMDMEDDFLDHNDDMAELNAFFKNQQPIYDGAQRKLTEMKQENTYLIENREMTVTLAAIREIVSMEKPYRRISELPDLLQKVEQLYGQLLTEKREEVSAEIQAAMAEIHQNAAPQQKDIMERADNALVGKRSMAAEATSLTTLDAMKPQIANLRQQYLRVLITPENTQKEEDIVRINRSTICHVGNLKTEADVDQYLVDVKEKLMEKLKSHDGVQII